MKTELDTFAVRIGMEAEAETWLRLLRERRAECVLTLERERMRYEAVFSSRRDGRMYLTWFSVQGEDGATLEGSPYEIDRIHADYWKRCIDPDVPPERWTHVVSFVPADVEAVVEATGR